MSAIVIRIVPESPVSGGTFTSFLNALGGLRITAFDLSFNSPTAGQNVGTAVYNAPDAGTPDPTAPVLNPGGGFTLTPPSYAGITTNGIVQQYDVKPPQIVGLNVESAYFELEAVATAVIDVTATAFENLRLVVQWGTGAGAQPIPITQEYYNVAVAPSTADPNLWAGLSPSLFLQIPAPPPTGGGTPVVLPTDGTPPSFNVLLTAITNVLGKDPGGTPALDLLTPEQCRNVAYEIIWSQQKPLPVPPDPIENLYSNPPNNGSFLSGSNPNQNEADRHQFEAELKGYYALADASADQLARFVYSVAAAVACEKKSVAATRAMLRFPMNPGQPIDSAIEDASIILTNLLPASGFGVPAAFFYALTASVPPQITSSQRYRLATGDSITHVLSQLTSAINSAVITDSETYISSALPAIKAAQAARRISALSVPTASSSPQLALSASIQPIVTLWLALGSALATPSSENYDPTADDTSFWPGAALAQPSPFLILVLTIVTEGFQIPPPTSASLTDRITQLLLVPMSAIPTVDTLKAVTDIQWEAFFQANPTWLPPFTRPGDVLAQIAAFVQHLQKYFDVTASGAPSTITYLTSAATAASPVLTFTSTAGIVTGMSVTGAGIPAKTTVVGPITASSVTLSQSVTVAINTNITFTPQYASGSAGNLPQLPAPSADWFQKALVAYGPFIFGSGFDPVRLQNAVEIVFPSSPEAQEWLFEALSAIDSIYQILNPIAVPQAFLFSLAEALYARGFRFASTITQLSKADFQKALAGTIAFDLSDSIYDSAALISPPSLSPVSPGGFVPVNPDGSLTNCIPLECQSPTGPVAYLSELLKLATSSTCDLPLQEITTLATSAATASGKVLPFSTTTGVAVGMAVSGTNIDADAAVTALNNKSVTLSKAITASVPTGSSITFTPLTLESAIAERRGPLADLAATCANLETPLLVIDLVNESLEYMGSVASPTHGVVYDTSSDKLAGHDLCDDGCKEKKDCNEPARIFDALPEYSTPASPVVGKNTSVEPLVFNNLKVDFSSCHLPYSQALDVSRTYLAHFKSCRFEEMRTFRKCITEFVLDPLNEPAGFQAHLWRYPIRIDTAIEYLGITPEEYKMLFQGDWPKPCGTSVSYTLPGRNSDSVGSTLKVWELYGFESPGTTVPWTSVVVKVDEFLSRTCLTYCELVELSKCTPVPFESLTADHTRSDVTSTPASLPDCEPCCLENLSIVFTDSQNIEQNLLQLAIFIRLWRKLKQNCCGGYSFCQLLDICDVLKLFVGGAINPDFIRQLAAFEILRDQFQLPLADRHDKPAPGAKDANRTHLLALWVGPSASKWTWATNELLEHVAPYAKRRHECDDRSPEFLKILLANLDPLSALVGFSLTPPDTWFGLPSHTLRFAEILAKIYASNFSIGELFYLFTTTDHLDGDDPFPLQDVNEAEDLPFDLPEEQHHHSLWALRHRLLETELSEGEIHHWSWKRIEVSLRNEFGFAEADIRSLGTHYFPDVLQQAGLSVGVDSRSYFSPLALANTVPQMWNIPPDGPFHYDQAGARLSARVPLSDRHVIEKLEHVRPLQVEERQAVQDLYFQPRSTLALFALLFENFAEAERHLTEEYREEARWAFFRKQFALSHRRCRIIAEHLSRHVAAVTGKECPEDWHEAMLLLRTLFADENKAVADWENDAGTTPAVVWTPAPNGGAFAALLGLVGTGLIAEYTPRGGPIAWRDVGGTLSLFDRERDLENCPVPTVLPAMDLALTPQQMQFISVLNGFAMKDASGAWIGGAQGFDVKWSGALMIEHEGDYEFSAGLPPAERQKPHWEHTGHRKWRVTLKRGQKVWVLLTHHWPDSEERHSTNLRLRKGAYEVSVELIQPPVSVHSDIEVRDLRTGLRVLYKGPDSQDHLTEIPHRNLFPPSKNDSLGKGISTFGAGASTFLSTLYVSSLRDIRRTYQRAFKALLFVNRFGLSAKGSPTGQSELGYFLAQKDNFAGASYYRSGGSFTQHKAGFDFNFLPLLDTYDPPTGDSRTNPSPQRMQAMFDWWERVFDYGRARHQVHQQCHRHLWLLFDEAFEKKPAHPGYLLRHMCADARHWRIDLRFYQDQSSPVYEVTSTDLEDERWVLRAWHADLWIRCLLKCFDAKDITLARPDLWASEDPSAPVSGETETGNANLLQFLCDGCFENGKPRRYNEVKRLNDGLRERGRAALLAYLCHMNRVPLPWPPPGQFATKPRELSDLLLLDVEAGICEHTTRIDEAICAVQNFIRRARLHLEPGWTVTRAFARMWDKEFASFEVWQACKRRHLYKENYIEWSELERARCVEAFRFLETKLKSCALTTPVPGGTEWWPQEVMPHPSLPLLQDEPSQLATLPPQPNSTTREGLNLLGTPDRDARPSWLAAVTSVTNGGFDDNRTGVALAGSATPGSPVPLWLESAIRLGTRFYRIAAAGVPPASAYFKPHKGCHEGTECVSCCEEACCAQCGKAHPPLVDEYYFWLVEGEYYIPPEANAAFKTTSPSNFQYGYQDDYYDPTQQQSSYWDDPGQLPQLLEWPAQPTVRLAWCRVHNGEFQQPRRSVFGVPVVSAKDADLNYIGRSGDSLTFSVTNPSVPTPPGYLDPSEPGFRYDLAPDDATVLPLVNPATAAGAFLGTLPAYPFFAYHVPGTPIFPLSPFSPALAVASVMRTHCHFEAALEWYRIAFDPLSQDNAWVHCGQTQTNPNQPPSETPGRPNPDQPSDDVPGILTGVPSRTNQPPADILVPTHTSSTCCDSTDITCDQAKTRSIVLHYLETLIEWGEATMRKNSPEAFEAARLYFDTARLILGDTPVSVMLPEPAVMGTVGDFEPANAPLNPRLLDIYGVVRDRLSLIHSCQNAKRLRNGKLEVDMPFFGNSPVREGWQTEGETCLDENQWCLRDSPYRFTFLVQNAKELASRTRELGSLLLSALEKGDAEFLASIRARHEHELATMGIEARKDQWRDADWQIEALQKTKAIAQTNLKYYAALIAAGLITGELAYQDLTITSTVLRGVSNISEGIAEGVGAIPNTFIGVAGFGGTPLEYEQLPIGTPLAGIFSTAARILNSLAEIASSTGALELTEGGWQRRNDEWVHQTQVLTIEIQQLERLILGAQRRRDQALADLNVQERQIEQITEVENFLRDKFTAHNLYLFLQKETASLYSRMYHLALRAAHQAESAFNFERGHTTRRFLEECAWDSLHEGLMAGERLDLALERMEHAYMDLNVREYELTKHFSLRLHFPLEYLRLRLTGCCEIELPEWMFDLDYPGMYMRRIKNVTLTIPCVSGPYVGVHCRLTLLSSSTRIDPRLTPPPNHCCCDGRQRDGYEVCHDDPRVVRQYAAREAIATSSGRNDSGMFELNFRDERYLPFEYMGAVCRLRIELPRENNFFDGESVTDAILQLNHTAREGGELLRRAANHAAQKHLPAEGWVFFDVKHDFPDMWELFGTSNNAKDGERVLNLELQRNLFPFLPNNAELKVDRLAVLFETEEREHECHTGCQCPCPEKKHVAAHELIFSAGHTPHHHHPESVPFRCVSDPEWSGLYHGIVETELPPFRGHRHPQHVHLEFPCEVGVVHRLFLFCRYKAVHPRKHECGAKESRNDAESHSVSR